MFKAKVRRIGNSLGVIIPSDVIDGLEVDEGDEILLAASGKGWTTADMVHELAGLYKGTKPFERDKRDRF